MVICMLYTKHIDAGYKGRLFAMPEKKKSSHKLQYIKYKHFKDVSEKSPTEVSVVITWDCSVEEYHIHLIAWLTLDTSY